VNEQPAPKTLPEALADADLCPRCLGELDTGWECNDCGYDAKDEAYRVTRAADQGRT
jgi:ribosomal protein L37AE/L43A